MAASSCRDNFNRGISGLFADDVSFPAHRLCQTLDLLPHRPAGRMHLLAVARQDPFETVVSQPCHRLGLPGPGIPAIVLGGRKLLPVPAPPEMVAGEKESVLEEQDAVALRVAWRGDGKKTGSQFPRPLAFEDDFRTWLRRQFVSMDDAATAKMLGVALGIGHVVPVRQEDVSDAWPCLCASYLARSYAASVHRPRPG